MFNIHHLELFYYVARHRGISEAVRNMPYGIQQPAVSAQILQLEDHLGVTLFQRRPFTLTPSGEQLFGFIRPFFDGLPGLEDEMRGNSLQLRMGGSGILLRDHLPELLLRVRERFPGVKFSLREGHAPQLEAWLREQELDLAVTVLDGKAPAGLSVKPFLELDLVLLVNKQSRIRSAEDLWKRDPIDEALICLPPTESIPRQFQQELGRKGLEWQPRIEVSSLSLIETYVAYGYGVGLYVDIPGYTYSPKIRVVRLGDFAPVTYGAMWTGKLTPVIGAFFEEMQARINALKR